MLLAKSPVQFGGQPCVEVAPLVMDEENRKEGAI